MSLRNPLISLLLLPNGTNRDNFIVKKERRHCYWYSHVYRELTALRWRKEYGGVAVEQAKRLKDLERENARLRRLVADLSLEKQILKDISQGNL